MADKIENDRNLAGERYKSLLSYLQYENSTYWARSNFMLVANSVLLGLTMQKLPEPSALASWMSVFVSFFAGVFGCTLSFLWWRIIEDGLWWINRWHDILIKIEPEVFGDIKVFRDANPPSHRVKNVPKRMASLFGIVWLAISLYSIVVAIVKISQ